MNDVRVATNGIAKKVSGGRIEGIILPKALYKL